MSGYLAISRFIYRNFQFPSRCLASWKHMLDHHWIVLQFFTLGTSSEGHYSVHVQFLITTVKHIEGWLSRAFVFFTHLYVCCVTFWCCRPKSYYCCKFLTFHYHHNFSLAFVLTEHFWIIELKNRIWFFTNVLTFLFHPQNDSFTLVEFGCSEKKV